MTTEERTESGYAYYNGRCYAPALAPPEKRVEVPGELIRLVHHEPVAHAVARSLPSVSLTNLKA